MPFSIDEIEELEDLFEIMKSFNLSAKGLKGADDIKVKLKEHLAALEGSSQREAGHTFQVLSEACKLDKRKRDKLCSLYQKTTEFFSELKEDVIVKNLEESLGDFRTTLKKSAENIRLKDHYVVLVAGETSAGKSSIINLILGEELLPYSILSTTSTICELRYGEKPSIRVHFKGGSDYTQVPIYQEFENSSEDLTKEIGEFLNLKDEREKGSPYQKVELFWPHDLLKEGVMIVDSPGVGENEAMNKFVLDYLSEAFCFIYVINSTNAGGVQEDRLLMLLGEAKSLKKDERMDDRLFTKCALFVSNKWDQIPGNNVEQVKQKQIEKLTERFGDLNPEKQIFYLSCIRAQRALKYGVITEEFDKLLDGISSLVVSYMQSSLQIYFRWLEDLLSRTSGQVRSLLKTTSMSRKELEKKIKRVMDRMAELESSQDQLFDELSEHQMQVIKGIINDLVTHFKSDDIARKFCSWYGHEIPVVKPTWEETKSEVLRCISERARKFVQEWEDEKHHFAKSQVALIHHCIEKYDIMEEDLRNVEEGALSGNPVQDRPDDAYSGLPAIQPKTLSKTHPPGNAPVWFRQGLASVVLSTPFMAALSKTLKRNFQNKKKLENFKTNPNSYMEKKSKKCLRIISNEDSLLPFITEQLEDAVQFLVQIKAKIPRIREGDKKFYLQLLTDSRNVFEIQGIYQPVNSSVDALRREIAVFKISSMRTSDFSAGKLIWSQDDKFIVGKGTFSTVYSGVLWQEGHPETKVALKVYNSPLRSSNVWHFTEEQKVLSVLKHPNIVKFFGTHLLQSPFLTKVMIVLELCQCSLKTDVISHTESAPAHSKDEVARKKVLHWAQQIIDALSYVHQQGYVHRDLKLDDLLLTADNKVKLSDVGVTKQEKEISGTVCGSLLYMAPEVLAGEMYDKRADMYSFGVLLWEMWYAETAFEIELFTQPSQFQLLDQIKDGLRPSHIKGTHEPLGPWGMWKKVMETCWLSEPKERLTAETSQ
ncbi:uncharacterized protein LOC111344030 [Stylophora pistillata]|uniref:uncharacterized protein LOC111344030 n=1 Tax=Stylophora pistillata TaxID=50429 RepID=UPI000C04D7E2|nr:uncharacterized protein LOC111344030 [Stylophora pistillata]XP_022806970.1 uncharacterized protein LOC111344030 [Stylophora pistillata]